MERNPREFPCEMDGEYVTLDECDYCSRKDACDVRVTMLNETSYEE